MIISHRKQSLRPAGARRTIFLALAVLGLGVCAASAATEKFRVIWRKDPAHQAQIGWCGGDPSKTTVHFGDDDFGTDWASYPRKATVAKTTTHVDLNHRFALLTDLEPDSKVFFVIREGRDVSPRFWFRTAPATAQPFTFVAGGDSRNHREARKRANRTVACLRPLFVCFGGDMISKPTTETWSAWLDDWQLTTGTDGRMTPIVPARGNHESKHCVHRTFNTLLPDDYSAFDIGTRYFRVYTLNSNITRAGKQGDWLIKDLSAHTDTRWKMAQYHHPFRPHTAAKKEQFEQYMAWSGPFFEFGMNLAIECDSHTVKRTWPVRPSTGPGSVEGFIRDDKFGTVFVGEGCWGAPLRPNNDDKPWTRDSASFNQVNWFSVTPERILCRTVQVDHVADFGTVSDSTPYEAPEGLRIWTPKNGNEVVILPRGGGELPPVVTIRVEIVAKNSPTGKSLVRLVAMDTGKHDDVRIRFTTDGSDPSPQSPVFTNPFQVANGTTIKAAIYENDSMLSAVSSTKVTRSKKKN